MILSGTKQCLTGPRSQLSQELTVMSSSSIKSNMLCTHTQTRAPPPNSEFSPAPLSRSPALLFLVSEYFFSIEKGPPPLSTLSIRHQPPKYGCIKINWKCRSVPYCKLSGDTNHFAPPSVNTKKKREIYQKYRRIERTKEKHYNDSINQRRAQEKINPYSTNSDLTRTFSTKRELILLILFLTW